MGMRNDIDTVETVWPFFKRIKIRTTIYEPEIPLLSIHEEKLKPASQRDDSAPVCTAAPFTTDKLWRQSKCLLTGERANKR